LLVTRMLGGQPQHVVHEFRHLFQTHELHSGQQIRRCEQQIDEAVEQLVAMASILTGADCGQQMKRGVAKCRAVLTTRPIMFVLGQQEISDGLVSFRAAHPIFRVIQDEYLKTAVEQRVWTIRRLADEKPSQDSQAIHYLALRTLGDAGELRQGKAVACHRQDSKKWAIKLSPTIQIETSQLLDHGNEEVMQRNRN